MMKKSTFNFLAFLTFFVATGTIANAQVGSGVWSFSNPKPFGFTSYAISYFSDNNAVVVGVAGGIARTTNGGGTWAYTAYTFANTNGTIVKPTFNDVQCIGATTVFAVGNNGTMIKSTDGGINWVSVPTPFSADLLEINTVFFLDENTGYIGGDPDPNTGAANIFKTTDGGSSWVIEAGFPAPPPAVPTPTTIYKIRFTPTGIGYAGGNDGRVYKFDGTAWKDYSITSNTVFSNVHVSDTETLPDGSISTSYYADNVSVLKDQVYRAIAIVNDTAVVVGTQNNGGLVRINTSTPAGQYFMANNGTAIYSQYQPIGNPQIYNLATKDGNTIFGASSNGNLLTSTDKGFTFHTSGVYEAGSPEEGIGFLGVAVSPSNRVGLCGTAGIIADSVTQWRRPFKFTKPSTSLFSGYGLKTISFADAGNGVAAGNEGTMLRTTDGGNNWEDVSNGSFSEEQFYSAVDYISPTALYAISNNGSFYKSGDNGTSFDLLFSEPNTVPLSAMHFINENTGWIVANLLYDIDYNTTLHPIIYRTTDGGNTWDSSQTVFPTETDFEFDHTLNDIKFLNANLGFAAGENGTVYKSTDGGVNWVQQTNLPAFALDKSLRSISIVDENIAYISGYRGLVMKTLNGGGTWVLCNNGLPLASTNYVKTLMYDASQGMVFASGAVYTTRDGGASWSAYYAPVTDALNAACFAPVNGCTSGICQKVYVAGMRLGNILKFDADIVLPVKFSNLTGAATSKGNQLFWTAFSQEQVTYFEIERSADGVSFKKYGDKILTNGMAYQSHVWLDEAPFSGKDYYRVKATENTGAVYYTNTILLTNRQAAKWNYQLSNGTLVLTNAAVKKGNVGVRVFNNTGQLMVANEWKQGGGAFNNFISLPLSAKGIYFVKINNEGEVYNFKIFIQ